jgi:hypothetical protein
MLNQLNNQYNTVVAMSKLNVKQNKLQAFVIWLDGYIEAVGDDGFNISKTNVVRNKLNNLFEHVAEPVVESPTLDELFPDNGLPSNYNLPQDPNEPVTFRC